QTQRVELRDGKAGAFRHRSAQAPHEPVGVEVSSKDTANPAKYFMAAPSRCLWRSKATTF
ncbi:hypothetical protein, partial [Mesorhizobium sp. M0590]|uniref:hypothetical protein n=1 Tax=Mesorhizobium sp. M0590 TaxID=2956966 RepID=UPI0033380FBD